MVESNQAIGAALALRKKISFEFKEKTYEFPSVIDNRFIVVKQIDGGSFGTIFDVQDTKSFDTNVVKVVSLFYNHISYG